MSMRLDAVRPVAPLLAPLLLIGAGWLVFIRPVSGDGARAARQIEAGRQRLAAVQASLSDPIPDADAGDPQTAFERQVSSRDAVPALIGHLTRTASAVGARNLLIDSTSPPVTAGAPDGPRAAGAASPDPRMALFDVPLVYSAIPMSFDASYEAAGELLWRLRDLPALVEIRSLEIKPRAAIGADGSSGASAAPHDGTVTVTMTLFVYARADAGQAAGAGEAAR